LYFVESGSESAAYRFGWSLISVCGLGFPPRRSLFGERRAPSTIIFQLIEIGWLFASLLRALAL
jgi:hypothetical protein